MLAPVVKWELQHNQKPHKKRGQHEENQPVGITPNQTSSEA